VDVDAQEFLRTAPMISADSHVVEEAALWSDHLPESFWPDATKYFAVKGGKDPARRLDEMAEDEVLAEVLYPSLGLNIFALGAAEADTQRAAFRTYNDWLVDFCSVAPEKLIGVACLSTYDIDAAVGELERAKANGMRGGMVWQVPDPTLPFSSSHYDPLWEAAGSLGMPISMHILTGHAWSANETVVEPGPIDFYRKVTNLKLLGVLDSLFELIFSGALTRHPDLRFVLVENEIGWIPWMLQIWDRYHSRAGTGPFAELPIEQSPTEIFEAQVYATFFEDAVGTYLLGSWGVDNCMWSSDFPHPNSTWPKSRQIVQEQLAHLTPEACQKVLHGTVASLYDLKGA
jgi:predicted TIM-barrel fold metal-dependent hydrolase